MHSGQWDQLKLLFLGTHTQSSSMLQELTLLEKVWVLVHDWDSVYSKWSGTQFMKISIDEMTATAQGYAASCQKLTKEARSWPVLLHLRVRCCRSRHNVHVLA